MPHDVVIGLVVDRSTDCVQMWSTGNQIVFLSIVVWNVLSFIVSLEYMCEFLYQRLGTMSKNSLAYVITESPEVADCGQPIHKLQYSGRKFDCQDTTFEHNWCYGRLLHLLGY